MINRNIYNKKNQTVYCKIENEVVCKINMIVMRGGRTRCDVAQQHNSSISRNDNHQEVLSAEEDTVNCTIEKDKNVLRSGLRFEPVYK